MAGRRSELREVAPWVVMTLVGWGLVVALRHGSTATTENPAPPWQHSFLELPNADQRRYREVREGVIEAENLRATSATKQWPDPSVLAADGVPPFTDSSLTWSVRQHGVYVNYVGVPREAGGLRWLVMFIEPEAAAFDAKAPAPPVDEEHHTLSDGTALHVTVWSMPNEGAVPTEVLAFPVSDGWVQRVGR